jgi:hypothetical protein
MQSLLVTFVFETAKKPEYDKSYNVRVSARNDAEALVLAKKILKAEHPSLNFVKNYYWDTSGRPNR